MDSFEVPKSTVQVSIYIRGHSITTWYNNCPRRGGGGAKMVKKIPLSC